MSPTLNVRRKTSDRKVNFVVNNTDNNNVFSGQFFNRNVLLEPLPIPQPILDFDGNDDQVDGHVQSTATQTTSSGNGRRSRKKKSELEGADVLVRKQAPTFLLIESLIWNFCRSNESDKGRQKELFDRLCQQLHKLQLIGSSFKSDSLQPIREFILLKFDELISQIRSQDNRFLLSSPSAGPVINSPHLLHQSRYRDDFEDLGLIEAGGFGVVHKAKYQFDECEYAVKMIRFKYTDKYDQVFKKIIREVQLYANLSSHPNVVAYKTAWLENWCLHREPLPLSKHLKASKPTVLTTNGDSYALENSLKKKDNSENDVSIRFEESSKSGIRIEASNGQISRHTSVDQYIQPQMTMDYRETQEESDEDEEESSSSDEESSNSDESVQTFRLQSFEDLTTIRGPTTKRKKTFSMSSTQSQSDSTIEYRESVQLQKYAKPDAIPEIAIDSCHPNGCPFSCSDFGAILYIQMELCGKNLKTWLRERNDRVFKKLEELVSERKVDKNASPVTMLSDDDQKEAKTIFRQVLKGVEYIHNKHLIHRDLKPQNILFSLDGSKVKIGDFGLATLHNSIDSNQVISPNLAQHRQFKQTPTHTATTATSLSSDVADNPELTHTGNIGTSIYASPEQKSRKNYDHKTDMFSLGLILFELFYPLSTEMEKVKCVSNITKKQCLPQSLVQWCPTVAKIILSMTNPNPVLRPNASELLHSSLFLTEEQMIIKQIEDQNKQIIQELSEKDDKIKQLENCLQMERQKRIEMELMIENMKKQMKLLADKVKLS